jgi:hypothetical protein
VLHEFLHIDFAVGYLLLLYALQMHLVLNSIDELLLELVYQLLLVFWADPIVQLVQTLDVELLHVGLEQAAKLNLHLDLELVPQVELLLFVQV